MKKELTHQQASDRIDKLRSIISEYRYEYHVNDKSIMDEAAADSLKHELETLENKFPDLITPDSPTQRVAGEPLPHFTSVEHKYRMLSLNDVFDDEEISAWQNRIKKLIPENDFKYFIDIKMDGLACSLIYQDGILEKGITRGNGRVGEDITQNIRTIDSIPLNLRNSNKLDNFLKGRTEIRGEIVMYKKDFEKLNKEREKQKLPLYANPRNLAAGTIRQLDPKLVAAIPLQFVAWDIIRENPSEVQTFDDAYNYLRDLGFYANTHTKVVDSTKEIMNYANHWEEKRKTLPYNTDGLVIKVNSRDKFTKLGIVGKAPRGAVAYKYPAEQATTKVKDIFISIGRTGAATPVAVLEPVIVAGSTVQMATLHNEGEVKRKDVRIGDTVIVHKAGDIIPEVLESLKKLRTGKEPKFSMPKQCPECGTELIKTKEDEAVWRCPNNSCPARVHNQIGHFASKAALDIDGLGEKNVLALLESNLIRDPADLYSLTKEQLLKLDRFAEVSASKLIKSIQSKKNPPLSRFIFALGIRHVGSQTATELANYFKSLDKLQKATVDELRDIEGVGEIMAESIVTWFADEQSQELLTKFNDHDVKPQTITKTNDKLKDQGFVISGSLESMEREEAGQKIRDLGGTFQSSVGKSTTYLVIGEKPGASKIKKAEQLGIKQINEDQLLKILNQ